MAKQPLTISWDELNNRKVEQRLREQQAMTRNRAYSKLRDDDLPVAKPSQASIWNNSTFCMAILGLIGGILAWGCGFLVQIQPAEQQAIDLMHGIQGTELQRDQGGISPADANASLALQRALGQSNPYFTALDDPSATPAQRQERLEHTKHRAQLKRSAANILKLGLSGMFLALCLGLGEPLSEHNFPRAVRNGALSAMLGLIGGVAVSLFIDRLYLAVGGGSPAQDSQQLAFRDVLARSCAWGVLGLFLAAGPGMLMGNLKKTTIGLAGGLIGGVVGGALFDPVSMAAGPAISPLVALCAIGLLTGIGTALIENAAKTGWLKVTGGLIAGKQFILYRNPTYIGSSPECQIYLFRDPAVGRRHAALHLIPGGVELENLPLGQASIVNGQAVSRARLHHGDKISIGATSFLFQEKVKK